MLALAMFVNAPCSLLWELNSQWDLELETQREAKSPKPELEMTGRCIEWYSFTKSFCSTDVWNAEYVFFCLGVCLASSLSAISFMAENKSVTPLLEGSVS